MYRDQLPLLLTHARELMRDATNTGAAIRLFALVPFDTGRTMSLGLGQSGGKVLMTFDPKEYDFVFFSHWFGGSAGDAKSACGAPFRLALLMWESPRAAATSPLSPAALDALRDWASLSGALVEPKAKHPSAPTSTGSRPMHLRTHQGVLCPGPAECRPPRAGLASTSSGPPRCLNQTLRPRHSRRDSHSNPSWPRLHGGH